MKKILFHTTTPTQDDEHRPVGDGRFCSCGCPTGTYVHRVTRSSTHAHCSCGWRARVTVNNAVQRHADRMLHNMGEVTEVNES
jgi:hypothetical protein